MIKKNSRGYSVLLVVMKVHSNFISGSQTLNLFYIPPKSKDFKWWLRCIYFMSWSLSVAPLSA